MHHRRTPNAPQMHPERTQTSTHHRSNLNAPRMPESFSTVGLCRIFISFRFKPRPSPRPRCPGGWWVQGFRVLNGSCRRPPRGFPPTRGALVHPRPGATLARTERRPLAQAQPATLQTFSLAGWWSSAFRNSSAFHGLKKAIQWHLGPNMDPNATA